METGGILERAAALLGSELTPEQTRLLELCCEAAKGQCLSGLREAPTEETAPLLLEAAALWAAGMFLDGGETEEVASFTAGKLSVTTRAGAVTRGQRFKTLAEALLAPYLESGPAFLGVRV